MYGKHREFLERLGDLMYKFGFNTVIADTDDGLIYFLDDDSNGNTLSFKTLHEGSFIDVTSSITAHIDQYDKTYEFCDVEEETE